MATKTQEYLRILAEGGDAPTDCCMTQTQELIAEAIDRINNIDGSLAMLNDYVDGDTFTVTDLEGLKQAINDGKAFYWNDPTGDGALPDGYFNISLQNGEIKAVTVPDFVEVGSGHWILTSYGFTADATTGIPTGVAEKTLPLIGETDQMGNITFKPEIATLRINIGSVTYEYDGTEDVFIDILDGENTEF